MRTRALTAVWLTGAFLVPIISCANGIDEPVSKGQIVAINVLLQPDQQMSSRARDLNGELRENYPDGFALDDSHVPHISILHLYVRDDDLPKVFTAIDRVAAERPVVGLELTANGLEHSPWQGQEVTSISVANRSELSALQDHLLDALRPYSNESGGADAFVTKPGEPQIGDKTIQYVSTFVAEHTGDNYEPHITVGISDARSADEVRAHFTHPVKFEIRALAVYQLGNVGTARKELWRYLPH